MKEKHAASYANDPQRAFVEYRKKVLGLAVHRRDGLDYMGSFFFGAFVGTDIWAI